MLRLKNPSTLSPNQCAKWFGLLLLYDYAHQIRIQKNIRQKVGFETCSDKVVDSMLYADFSSISEQWFPLVSPL